MAALTAAIQPTTIKDIPTHRATRKVNGVVIIITTTISGAHMDSRLTDMEILIKRNSF
jgi:hypothetical protein